MQRLPVALRSAYLCFNVRRASSHRLPPTALRPPARPPPRPLPPACLPCFARQPPACAPFCLRARNPPSRPRSTTFCVQNSAIFVADVAKRRCRRIASPTPRTSTSRSAVDVAKRRRRARRRRRREASLQSRSAVTVAQRSIVAIAKRRSVILSVATAEGGHREASPTSRSVLLLCCFLHISIATSAGGLV